MSELGEALRDARRARRLSQREAAALAGVSDTTWSQVEKGYVSRGGRRDPKPPPLDDNLARMAGVVGLDVREAFRLAGKPLPDDVEIVVDPDRDVMYLGRYMAERRHLSLAEREQVAQALEAILRRRDE